MPHKVTCLLGFVESTSVVRGFWTAWIRDLIMSTSINRYATLIILRWSPIYLVLLILRILFNSSMIRLKFVLHIDLIHHLLLFVEIPRHQVLSCWVLRVDLSLFKHLAPTVLGHSWIICCFIVNRVSARVFPCSINTNDCGRTDKGLFVRVHLIVIDASYLVRS